MKYLKFTHVDAITGISVASEPARNGPSHPAVVGLQFVWARESAYPTHAPEFFGTCPDASDTQIDGVLALYAQSDWEQMQADEMNARLPPPYARSRIADYPSINDYIDGIVKGDTAQIQAYIDACLAVKTKYPKPE